MAARKWAPLVPYVRLWHFAMAGETTRINTHKRCLHRSLAKHRWLLADAVGKLVHVRLKTMYRQTGAATRVVGLLLTGQPPPWYWAKA